MPGYPDWLTALFGGQQSPQGFGYPAANIDQSAAGRLAALSAGAPSMGYPAQLMSQVGGYLNPISAAQAQPLQNASPQDILKLALAARASGAQQPQFAQTQINPGMVPPGAPPGPLRPPGPGPGGPAMGYPAPSLANPQLGNAYGVGNYVDRGYVPPGAVNPNAPAPAATPAQANAPAQATAGPSPRFGLWDWQVPGMGARGGQPVYTAMNLGRGPAPGPLGASQTAGRAAAPLRAALGSNAPAAPFGPLALRGGNYGYGYGTGVS